MQVTNTFFLIHSASIIKGGFRWKKERASKSKRYRLAQRELHTIVKLGVIMGNITKYCNIFGFHPCTGVFWIGEFVSTAIGIEYCLVGCSNVVCIAQIILDIPNLLAVAILVQGLK